MWHGYEDKILCLEYFQILNFSPQIAPFVQSKLLDWRTFTGSVQGGLNTHWSIHTYVNRIIQIPTLTVTWVWCSNFIQREDGWAFMLVLIWNLVCSVIKRERKGAKVKGWMDHATLFGLAGSSNMCAAAITNPVNVVKVRMQLDGALSGTQVPGTL